MSSTGHMTPRSLLAHRPIGADMPDIVPWVKRASRRILTTPRVPYNRVSSRQHAHLSWETVVGLSMVLTLLLIVFSHVFIDWTTMLYLFSTGSATALCLDQLNVRILDAKRDQ